MPGTVFIPLDAAPGPAAPPYQTHCLWKTSRDNAGLATFVDAVRAASAKVG